MTIATPPAERPCLITQCIQRDFVAPLGRFDPLPNLLHIGAEEARRLMGDGSTDGPVGRLLQWAYGQTDEQLQLVHIRDWHDAADPQQREHLRQFGSHCLRDTTGAEFAFVTPRDHGKDVAVIDSFTLNDFLDTPLPDVLRRHPEGCQRFGLMGVWTEAKITFLAYELRSRYPDADIAICSALTASSSRSHHFLALAQLRQILGVTLIDSIGEFIEFLGGSPQPARGILMQGLPECGGEGPALDAEDETLLRYLFRDCRRIQWRAIGGGYSGSRVLACNSEDGQHRMQAPSVLKLGERKAIARERTAFEQIEAVLGNAAPSIDDHADLGHRGAIRYRYASMDFGAPVTFQRRYQEGLAGNELSRVLDIVFREQLGRLYAGAERDSFDLLAHYGFTTDLAAQVRNSLAAIIDDCENETIGLPGGIVVPNPLHFYRQVLPRLPSPGGRSWWCSWVHGDLNGANIVIDSRRNVWVIDFSHAGRAHVLRDLVKFENDLLYIWTPCTNEAAFIEGTRVIDAVLAIEDLAAPLPGPADVRIESGDWLKAWDAVRQLRSYYPPLIQMDRDPLQLFIAQLRYAAHTLSFAECNDWQKRLALYGAGHAARCVETRLDGGQTLRIDWLPAPLDWIGITLLPGRRDYQRRLDDDLTTLTRAGVTHVLSALTRGELERHGVPQLGDALCAKGLRHTVLDIPDQQAASAEQFEHAFRFIDAARESGGRALIHCVGGLGRSGMLAAGYLVSRGHASPDDAVRTVRRVRSTRAIETTEQEHAVARLAPHTPPQSRRG